MTKTHPRQPTTSSSAAAASSSSTVATATERTRLLLMPSPNSTDKPSRDNLKGLLALEEGGDAGGGPPAPPPPGHVRKSSSEVQLVGSPSAGSLGKLLEGGGDGDYYPDSYSDRAARRRKRRNCRIAAAVILAAIAVAAAAMIARRFAGTSTAGGLPSPATTPPATPAKKWYKPPLSLSHPVLDLGLQDYPDRPKSSKPPSDLFSSAFNKTALPTNSWYQNLLLLEDGQEPTSFLQRSYAVPYVVDVAPDTGGFGLRVQPNHVGATQDVVQVYAQENFGLSVGADYEYKSRASSSSAAAAHGDDEPSSKLSLRYRIRQTTDLAVTLAWEDQFKVVGVDDDPRDDDRNGGDDDGEPTNRIIREMTSSIVKGMPYATVAYHYNTTTAAATTIPTTEGRNSSSSSTPQRRRQQRSRLLLPTVASSIGLAEDAIVDNDPSGHRLRCVRRSALRGGDDDDRSVQEVRSELEMMFDASDFTWLVFFSEPVKVRCVVIDDPDKDEVSGIRIQVVGRVNYDDSTGSDGEEEEEELAPLVVRAALYKSCTSGRSPIYCHQEQMHATALLLGQGEYGRILREHAHLYPGPNARFGYDVDQDNGSNEINMIFDWDVQDMTSNSSSATLETSASSNATSHELIAFALPHHFDLLGGVTYFGEDVYCTASLIGPACLVEGSTWHMTETVPEIGLRAPRPPAPWSIEAIGRSLQEDIKFVLPSYYRRGAGDTYFSGKMLAKLGRILLVAEEVAELCSNILQNKEGFWGRNNERFSATSSENMNGSLQQEYDSACAKASFPSKSEMENAVESLRQSTEVWINGNAETPFVFDSSCT